jgi:hypothetical protein
MTKKNLLIRGWVGVSRFSCSSTNGAVQQCINNRLFVTKSFKMPNFTNVELTDIRCGGWQHGPSANTVPGTVSRQGCT